MSGFARCPSCGLFENRRTSCVCGYALKEVSPASVPEPSDSDHGTATKQSSKKPQHLLKNTLIVAAWIAVCGVGVYFFVPKTSSYSPSQIDVEDVRKDFDRIKQNKVAAHDSTNRKLTALLQSVQDDETAQKAMFECYLKGGEAVQVGMLEANFDISRDRLPVQMEVDKKLQTRGKLSESAEELIAEFKKVAVKYPRAFYATTENLGLKRIKSPEPTKNRGNPQ